MKNVYEVLRQKELEQTRVQREVEALRIAAPLLVGPEPRDFEKEARADMDKVIVAEKREGIFFR